ncbi:MAG: hypothetical protein NXH75_17400 [Halobacteriovoraceae bacterium]|nr:hypothetical protein [Halobacteriovoraceae bacterium]
MENWDGDYNSSIGRFISEDPSFIVIETLNEYLYSLNEPTGRTDWNGKRSRKEIAKYNDIKRQLEYIRQLERDLNTAVSRRDYWVPQLITKTIEKCNKLITIFDYDEIKNPFDKNVEEARRLLKTASTDLEIMQRDLRRIAREVNAICNGQKDQYGRVKKRSFEFDETTECEASLIE